MLIYELSNLMLSSARLLLENTYKVQTTYKSIKPNSDSQKLG